MEAATAAPNFLKKLDLRHIPRQIDTRLLQLIAAACMTASDVTLLLHCDNSQEVPWQQPAPLHEALSHNTSLTCLTLAFRDAPCYCISFDYLLSALTGLQSLSLANYQPRYQPRGDASCTSPLPAPTCIVNQLCLTHLRLGPGFHLTDLSTIIPHMAPMKVLDLTGDHRLQPQDLPDLSPLTALQTLKLKAFQRVNALPPLAKLTTLQTLVVSSCEMLQQLPSLATLTALQTLKLCELMRLLAVPPLNTLTALKTLELRSCGKLQGFPALAALTALQTLRFSDSGFRQKVPKLDTLTALQTLELRCFALVREMPPLATLTALQTLELALFNRLQRLPSLATLTALQKLEVQRCCQLRELPPLDTLTALQILDLTACEKLERIPSLSNLSALQTIVLTRSPEGLESTFQHTLPKADIKIERLTSRYCRPLRQW
jgi:Leucine-rich repeat (LRR) protein